MIVVYRRAFSFAPIFLIARLEAFAKVHAPEAGRHAHVMITTDVRAQLDFPTVVARRC